MACCAPVVSEHGPKAKTSGLRSAAKLPSKDERVTHPRRGAADRGQRGAAAGAVAQSLSQGSSPNAI
jgi:hypothetical protein